MRQCHKTLIPAFSGTLSSFDTCRKFREHSCSRLHLMWLLCCFRSLQTSFKHHNSMMYAEVWINCKWKCLHGKKLACPKGVHLTWKQSTLHLYQHHPPNAWANNVISHAKGSLLFKKKWMKVLCLGQLVVEDGPPKIQPSSCKQVLREIAVNK